MSNHDATAAAPVAFDIRAQRAASALIAFGKQANVTVLVRDDARDAAVPGLQGDYGIADGLERLLAGTGLEYRFSGDSIIIERSAAVEAPVEAPQPRRAARERRSVLAGIAALLTSLAAGSGAVAAENSTETGTRKIEEIVVTATKRSQSVQDVPISITALTAEDIQASGAQSLMDLAEFVPNLVFPASRTPLEADIAIRGIFSNIEFESIGFDAGFSVYVDGVYQGNQSAANPELMEIERVEVLRGPQGTLFGKNTIAGAINIVSRRPDNEPGGSITAEVGNLDARRFAATVNIPLIEDVLAVRAAVGGRWRDGYVTNTTLNDPDVGNVDQQSGRVSVSLTPNERWGAYLSIDVLDSDIKAYNLESLTGDDIPYTIDSDGPETAKQEKLGAALTVERDFANGYGLTWITGYRDDEGFFLKDVDETSLNGLNFHFTGTQKLITQELRLASPEEDRVNYVAGLYYLDQKSRNLTDGFIGGDWIAPFDGFVMSFDATVDTTSYAAFLHVNVDVTDRWTLFGGGRYTSEEKELSVFQSGDPPGFISLFGWFVGEVPIPTQVDEDEPTWSLGTQYFVSDEHMLYAGVSRGYKSGSFTAIGLLGQAALDEGISVAPEFVTNYEVGAKSTWLDGRLQTNLALFYMDYSDLQVRSFDPTGGVQGTGQAIWSNAAEVTSKGFEIDVRALLADALTAIAGVGYVDSTYDEFTGLALPRGPGDTPAGAPSLALDLNDGVVDGLTDASGNRVPLAPKWNVNLALQHDHRLGNGAGLVSRIEYQHVAGRYSAQGSANFDFDERLPAYDTVNLRAGYESASGAWRVYVWAKNVFDENELVENRYSAFVIGRKEQRYMEPRTYGATLTYNL